MSQNKERSGGQQKHSHGRKRHHHSKHNRQRQPRPAPHLNYESLLLRFTACVDCGYFFTAYRAHHGVEVVREALKASNQNRDGWIELPWDLRTSELVHRFYAVRSDTQIDHLEFLCDGCQRKFVCAEIDDEASTAEMEPESDDAERDESFVDAEEEEATDSVETEDETEDETGDETDEEETAVDESVESESPRPKPTPRILRIELKTR